MGTVIGPISLSDWENMLRCKGNIEVYKLNSSAKWARAIEQQARIFKNTLKSYVDREAA